MTPEQIKETLKVAKNLVKLAQSLAWMTPTELDDKILASLESIIQFVEPLTDNPAFAEVVSWLIKVFEGKSSEQVLAYLQSIKQ